MQKVWTLGRCIFALKHVFVDLAFFVTDDALMTVKHAILADGNIDLVSKLHLHDLFDLFALFALLTTVVIASVLALVLFFTFVILQHDNGLMECLSVN